MVLLRKASTFGRYQRPCRLKRGMSSPSRCCWLMSGVGDRGLGMGRHCNRPSSCGTSGRQSWRAVGIGPDQTGDRCRPEAVAAASAILNDAPRACTRLETEVLEFLEAWQCAERGAGARGSKDSGTRSRLRWDAGFDRSGDGPPVRLAPAARRVPLRRRSARCCRRDTRPGSTSSWELTQSCS